jgi:hypothetical protein
MGQLSSKKNRHSKKKEKISLKIKKHKKSKKYHRTPEIFKRNELFRVKVKKVFNEKIGLKSLIFLNYSIF